MRRGGGGGGGRMVSCVCARGEERNTTKRVQVREGREGDEKQKTSRKDGRRRDRICVERDVRDARSLSACRCPKVTVRGIKEL